MLQLPPHYHHLQMKEKGNKRRKKPKEYQQSRRTQKDTNWESSWSSLNQMGVQVNQQKEKKWKELGRKQQQSKLEVMTLMIHSSQPLPSSSQPLNNRNQLHHLHLHPNRSHLHLRSSHHPNSIQQHHSSQQHPSSKCHPEWDLAKLSPNKW